MEVDLGSQHIVTATETMGRYIGNSIGIGIDIGVGIGIGIGIEHTAHCH